MTKVWRGFHIEAPKELETIYEKLHLWTESFLR